MGKQTRKSGQEKQQILQESQTLGLIETARKHGLSYQTLKNWQDIYTVSGLEGLKPGAGKLSPELKRLLMLYLTGSYTNLYVLN